ncbi:MAG: FxsA family protein [Myxococcota bacterium]
MPSFLGMGTLVLLFILIPAIELGLLIQVGSFLGVLPTLALVVGTGIVGASLAKSEGLRTFREIQARSARGEMPTDQLVDGAMILFAGALLITPGILTDLFGFACLIPGTRKILKGGLRRHFERSVRQGSIRVTQIRVDPVDRMGGIHGMDGFPHGGAPGSPFGRPGPRRPPGPVLDVDPASQPDAPADGPDDSQGSRSRTGTDGQNGA